MAEWSERGEEWRGSRVGAPCQAVSTPGRAQTPARLGVQEQCVWLQFRQAPWLCVETLGMMLAAGRAVGGNTRIPGRGGCWLSTGWWGWQEKWSDSGCFEGGPNRLLMGE